MKPTKNRFYCPQCDRTKILFETEKEAEKFIKYNAEEIKEENGKCPIRTYYCKCCGGWHVTSKAVWSETKDKTKANMMAASTMVTLSKAAKGEEKKINAEMRIEREKSEEKEKNILEKEEKDWKANTRKDIKRIAKKIDQNIDKQLKDISKKLSKKKIKEAIEEIGACYKIIRRIKDVKEYHSERIAKMLDEKTRICSDLSERANAFYQIMNNGQDCKLKTIPLPYRTENTNEDHPSRWDIA